MMEIGGYDTQWYVPYDTDILMEAETVFSMWWPCFVMEYDEDDERRPPKQKNFYIYKSPKAKRRIEETGINDELKNTMVMFITQPAPEKHKHMLLTIVTDKPEGEIAEILKTLKDNMEALDVRAQAFQSQDQ
jgi:hypothetical protein